MMNWFGIILAVFTLFVIGSGFIWVILGERYLGQLWWPYFMGLGFLLIFISVAISSVWGSAILGSLGASLIWGSTELKEQAVRAQLGLYPYKAQKISPPFKEIIEKWPTPHL